LYIARQSGDVAKWEAARALDPDLIGVSYYLAHAYHQTDGKDQSRALAEGGRLLAVAQHKVLRCDVYELLGDCYFKAEKVAEARRMYRRSMDTVNLVKSLNLAAQEGLLGL
jgi:hypothetical protein